MFFCHLIEQRLGLLFVKFVKVVMIAAAFQLQHLSHGEWTVCSWGLLFGGVSSVCAGGLFQRIRMIRHRLGQCLFRGLGCCCL